MKILNLSDKGLDQSKKLQGPPNLSDKTLRTTSGLSVKVSDMDCIHI